MKYIRQPENSKLCGQTCLAMIINSTIEDICEIMEKKKGTYNKDIYKVLDKYNIKYRYKRNNKLENLPELAIVKIGFKNFKNTN